MQTLNNASQHPLAISIYKLIAKQTLLDSFTLTNIFDSSYHNTYFVFLEADGETAQYKINLANQTATLVGWS